MENNRADILDLVKFDSPHSEENAIGNFNQNETDMKWTTKVI